jgi:hypothetical protein
MWADLGLLLLGLGLLFLTASVISSPFDFNVLTLDDEDDDDAFFF